MASRRPTSPAAGAGNSWLEACPNQAQLEALRARLNPHFLFISLQNISVLTKQDPQTASRMLTVLGDLLRAVLRSDSQPEKHAPRGNRSDAIVCSAGTNAVR